MANLTPLLGYEYYNYFTEQTLLYATQAENAINLAMHSSQNFEIEGILMLAATIGATASTFDLLIEAIEQRDYALFTLSQIFANKKLLEPTWKAVSGLMSFEKMAKAFIHIADTYKSNNAILFEIGVVANRAISTKRASHNTEIHRQTCQRELTRVSTYLVNYLIKNNDLISADKLTRMISAEEAKKACSNAISKALFPLADVDENIHP